MSAGEETLESLRKRAEAAEKKAEWLERKNQTVADLAGASHKWNVKERDRLRARAEDAETKWAEAVEVLEEFKTRSELIAQRTCTGSISSREAHARGTGYAEAAKAGLAALRGDNAHHEGRMQRADPSRGPRRHRAVADEAAADPVHRRSRTCDDCGLTAETSTDMDSGANEIEVELDPGWTHEAGEDWCPACSRGRE